MTGAEHAQEESLPVEANSAALNQLARLFEDLTPAGTLRVILQADSPCARMTARPACTRCSKPSPTSAGTWW